MNAGFRRVRRFALLLAAFLHGCAIVPPFPPQAQTAQADSFHLVGRVSVRQGEESFSGTLDWWHRAQEDEVELRGPLGQGVARLARTPGAASLTTARGEVHAAADVEELSERVLGWRLPLSALTHWVQGRPAPGPVDASGHDGEGRIAFLVQEGWRIEYGAWRDGPGGILPGRLTVEGRGLRLRLVVDAWQ